MRVPERVLERVQSLDDEPFTTSKLYFIKAVRNHNWIAAERLALVYYPFDKVEARAWLLIAAEAEKFSLDPAIYSTSKFARQGAYDYRREMRESLEGLTVAEKQESESRADELIAEFELAPGLLPPEGC